MFIGLNIKAAAFGKQAVALQQFTTGLKKIGGKRWVKKYHIKGSFWGKSTQPLKGICLDDMSMFRL
tara:strand:- start:42 stop:239 length:198 start_codon:yes stop_codon:yes gene_type:complete